jgi:hypothetical protein
MTTAKWNDERTAQLIGIAGRDTSQVVSKETVESAATALETTVRSIASKLRKIGYPVASMAKENVSAFTAEEGVQLAEFVKNNSGNLTYADIAGGFAGGKFSAKQVQGKILSQELTGHVKATEKLEVARTYSETEEAAFVKLAKEGAFLEEIAARLGKELNSVRGKALSMLRSGVLEKIPAQKESHATASSKDIFEGVDIANLTVEEIAKQTGKTDRGIRTTLTKRGLVAKDYDGAAKKIKAEEKRSA